MGKFLGDFLRFWLNTLPMVTYRTGFSWACGAVALVFSVATTACGDDDGAAAASSSNSGGAGGAASTSSSTTGGAATSSTAGGNGGNGPLVPQGWSTAKELPSPRQETAVVALSGEVVVIGGFDDMAQVVDTVEAYLPTSDTWRTLAPLPLALHHVHAAIVNDELYVLGGLSGLNFTAIGSCYRYDAANDAWIGVANMPPGTERGGGIAGAIGGKIYVAGGLRLVDAVTDFSVYDPAQDQWQALPAMAEALDHLAGGVVDGATFVVAGGRDGSISGIRDRVDSFSPAAGVWASQAPLAQPRGGTMSAVLDNRLYVIGGEGNPNGQTGVFSESASFDLTANSWRVEEAMVSPVHGTGAAVVDGVIYIPGGASTQAFGAVDIMQRYRP